LAWRDILVRYKTTIGITWALARPLLIMLVFTLVFSATLCGVRGTQSARSLRHLEMAGRTRLAAHSQETGLEVVIVRPPLVYGPGLKGNFISLLAAIDRGIPLPLAGANNVRSLVVCGQFGGCFDRLCDTSRCRRTDLFGQWWRWCFDGDAGGKDCPGIGLQ
jgi:hypothetical protein